MNEMDPEIRKRIEALPKKYEAPGQDLNPYLEGLLHELTENDRRDEGLVASLGELDGLFNIGWGLPHCKSAIRYLQQDTADIAAKGGTDRQEYLPSRSQCIVFFPELFEEELAEWGREWVSLEVFEENDGE